MRCACSLLALAASTATAMAIATVTATMLAAQTPDPGPDPGPALAAITAAATTIRPADLARHFEVLAGKPSPEGATSLRLEATARYIAEQFQVIGLRPHGDQTQLMDTIGSNTGFKMVTILRPNGSSSQKIALDTSFLQRYPLPGNMTVSAEGSRINFTVMLRKQGKSIIDANQLWPTEAVKTVSPSFAADVFFAADSVPHSGGRGRWASYAPPQAFLMAGPHTVQTVQAAQLHDKLVFYIPHAQADTATRREILDRLCASNHVVILSAEDSSSFAARRRAAAARPVVLVDKYMEDALGARHWAVDVRADALKELLAVSGIDPAAARIAAVPTVRLVPSVTAALDHVQPGAPVDSTRASASAPNVIGFIPGSDTTVRDEYVVYSARMDPAASVAGLIELAKAFSQPDARPRRSVLFVALSGGAPDFAGATYFTMNPPVSAADLTVNLALGPLGRSASDSVTIAGLGDFELASRPEWLASQHGEPGIAIADGGTILTADAHYLPFIRRAVPSLYFSGGSGVDAGTTSADDFEQPARALRLAFYVGQDIANAPRSVTWTSASRRERVRFLGR